MEGVDIRPAVSRDVDPIVALWIDLVREQQDYGTVLEAEGNRPVARRWTAELIAHDGLQVAERDGDIIGFASYEREFGRFDRRVTTGIIHNLMVREGERGAGIGAALLEAAESALADRGVERVRLETMAENEDAARFYQNRGYSIHRHTYVRTVPETDTHNSDDREG